MPLGEIVKHRTIKQLSDIPQADLSNFGLSPDVVSDDSVCLV
jgi:hypothetical protein